MAQACTYLACAPKSNASYMAMKAAKKMAGESGSLMPPMHATNAPTKLMKDIGYGKGYDYDHDAPDAFSGQNYFPDGMNRRQFYRPVERGFFRQLLLDFPHVGQPQETPRSGGVNRVLCGQYHGH
jgi:putative ATPase